MNTRRKHFDGPSLGSIPFSSSNEINIWLHEFVVSYLWKSEDRSIVTYSVNTLLSKRRELFVNLWERGGRENEFFLSKTIVNHEK